MLFDFNPNGGEVFWVSCKHPGARVVFSRYKSGAPKFREYCDLCQNFTESGYSGCGLAKAIKRYGRIRVFDAQSDKHITLKQKRPNYRQYIASDAWFTKRQEIMLRSGGMCEVAGCGSEAEQVHHKHYDSLGNENPEDLMAVCVRCHEEIHDDPRF